MVTGAKKLRGFKIFDMKVFITLTICLLFISCKKEYVYEMATEFVGEWHSIPVTPSGDTIAFEKYIIIEGQHGIYGGSCVLGTTDCGSYYQGQARINKNKTRMWIGKTFEEGGRGIFNIDKYPFINADGKWECQLTGTVYIKN